MKEEDIYRLLPNEIINFLKVWLIALLSLSYCYFAGKLFPPGGARLATVLPVIGIFIFLPLQLHFVHFIGSTGLSLAWLANFKLLMFAISGEGPLAVSEISLPRFLTVGCLPVKLRRNDNSEDGNEKRSKEEKSVWNYAVKAILLSLLQKIYNYEGNIGEKTLMIVYSIHIYLALEILLLIGATVAKAMLGVELEPQFDEPYLSTSLQDFWGRRWNIMVTRILRPTVYMPVLRWSSSIIGRNSAPLPAVMATFMVSGVIHELVFYYLGREWPTWEITWFFLLHGTCLMLEISVKKAVNGRWRLPTVIARVMTVGFIFVTATWLFFPPLLRTKTDERGKAEFAAVGALLKSVLRRWNLQNSSTI